MATPKKKHLIELMIEAGVKWPDGAEYAAQDKYDLHVWFYSEKPKFAGVNKGKWTSYVDYESGRKCLVVDGEKLNTICCDWHQTIVTREQYEKALADTSVTPTAQPSPEYCASVMRQMPDNTIEQLTADYRAKAAEADRLQAVADEALKATDDALISSHVMAQDIRKDKSLPVTMMFAPSMLPHWVTVIVVSPCWTNTSMVGVLMVSSFISAPLLTICLY